MYQPFGQYRPIYAYQGCIQRDIWVSVTAYSIQCVTKGVNRGWVFDGGGGGGSGQEFIDDGGRGVRVQVRGNFHIRTSQKK